MTEASFDPARERRVHGGAAPLPPRVPVRAGPLSLVLEAGDVRHVHVGPREVVRRIYGAVRDRDWRTIPARISSLDLTTADDAFTCRYRAEHRDGPVAFTWDATIEGRADGSLSFLFDGIAGATFERNRIGLCLLHPTPGAAGARVRATTTAGALRPLQFPEVVAVEQPIAGFRDLARLACAVGPGLWLEAAFEGDVFETEDQRNWIDASYKTYSTPSALPKPVTVTSGTRIRQRVTLRLLDESGLPARVPDAPAVIDRPSAELRFGNAAAGRLPAIGLRLARAGDGSRVAAALAPAQPAHVRVDVDLDAPDASAALERAVGIAAGMAGPGASPPPLELALHLPAAEADADTALDRLTLPPAPVARLLAVSRGHAVTQPGTLAAVRTWRTRQAIHRVPIATGTAGDLVRINLARPPEAEAVCWAMHPQAHATDLTSIAETPGGAHDQVIAVRRYFPGRPMAITASFSRPGQPDPRIGSLFAAGWTLALLAALGQAGAESVRLADAVPDHPDAFAARPLAHVVAALTTLGAGRLRPVPSSLDTLHACAIERAEGRTLLLANLSPRPIVVALPPRQRQGEPVRTWRLRVLDADAATAWTAPTALTAGETTAVRERLTLGPCAIARLDGSAD